MDLINRCYGCGKLIWPWQNAIKTKKVGRIHKACAFSAIVKQGYEEVLANFFIDPNMKAEKELGVEK